MRRVSGIGLAAFLIGTAAPLDAQDRVGSVVDQSANSFGALRQDTLPVDSIRGLRLRLEGGLLSDLPADDAYTLLRFFPGFLLSESGTLTYRASQARIATYLDGVPVRSLITGRPGLVPALNALGAITMRSSGPPASRSGATVIEYATRSGGSEWRGDVRVHTDAPAPGGWTQYQSRFQLSAAGPVPGVNGLHLAVAGHVLGQKFRQLPGSVNGQVYIASGIDTTFTLPRSGGDSVQVTVPEYEPWNYDELPLGNRDRTDLATALTFRRGAGDYGLRYYRSSVQAMTHSLGNLYNPVSWLGEEDIAQLVSLSLSRPLVSGVTADVVVSHQSFDFTTGALDPSFARKNAQPALGITTGSLGFLADRDDWAVTEPMLIAMRSGILPVDEMTLTTSDNSLAILRQGVAGVAQALRMNPYGLRTRFPISGIGSAQPAAAWSTERRWYGRAALSRTFGLHTVQIGGELDRTRIEQFTLPIADWTASAFRENRTSSTAFVQAGTSIRRFHIDAGVRVEQRTTDALLPRVPGFVWNVPDSLRADSYVLRPGEEPWEQRLERVVDCGGAATAPQRTNARSGALVCKDNFEEAPSHSVVSPRIGVQYAGSGRFSARAAYGSYTQRDNPTEPAFTDLSYGGIATPQPRDTDPVRENVAELGLRVRTMQDSWVDVQLFRLDVANPIVVRQIAYVSPVSGATFFIPVPVNGESVVTTGIELSALQRLSPWSGVLASFGLSQTEENDGIDTPAHAAAIVWIDAGSIGAPAALAPVLDNLTIHATAAYTGGGAYTRLVNTGEGVTVGRIRRGIIDALAEPLNSSHLPARTDFDLRIAKGFRIGGTTARLVADLRNPLGIDNVHTIFAETGTTENELYRDQIRRATLFEYTGLGSIQDRVIADWPENELNRFMLQRAEQRYGNGDGIFTTAEMTAAVDSYLELVNGPQWLSDGDRELRLGIEVRF